MLEFPHCTEKSLWKEFRQPFCTLSSRCYSTTQMPQFQWIKCLFGFGSRRPWDELFSYGADPPTESPHDSLWSWIISRVVAKTLQSLFRVLIPGPVDTREDSILSWNDWNTLRSPTLLHTLSSSTNTFSLVFIWCVWSSLLMCLYLPPHASFIRHRQHTVLFHCNQNISE